MKRVFAFALVLLLIPKYAFADSVSINCPKQITVNSEFTCELVGYTESTVSSLSAQIVLSEGFSFVAFSPNKVWLGDGLDGNIQLYTADVQTNKFKIGNIKLRNNGSSGTITVNSIHFYDDNDKEIIVSDAIRKIENNNENINQLIVLDDNNQNVDDKDNNIDDINSAFLADLLVNNYEINFVKEETNYKLHIDDNVDKLDIIPLLEDNSSTYEIIGNEKLKNGSIIKIHVKSVDDADMVYQIKIEKNHKNNILVMITFIVIIVLLLFINIARLFLNKKREGIKNG